MPRAVVLLAALLLAPVAGASTTMWDEPRRDLDSDVVVEAGETLVLRGVEVRAGNVTIEVRPGGRLVLESTATRAASLSGPHNGTLALRVNGTLVARGTPEMPVVVSGLGGVGGVLSATAAISGGLTLVGGELDAEHTVFSNYASGILAARGATVRLSHVRLDSPTGAGLIATGSTLDVDNLTARGAGATLFVTQPAQPFLLQDASFESAAIAITLRQATAQLSRVAASEVHVCVNVLGRSDVVVEDLACSADSTAVAATPPDGRSDGGANVTLVRAVASSLRGDAIVRAVDVERLVVRDSTLGPSPGAALQARRSATEITNTTFVGIGTWAVDEVSPRAESALVRLGEPGEHGWARLSRSLPVRVVDADGEPVEHASVTVLDADGSTVLTAETTPLGTAASSALPARRVGPDGAVETLRYTVEVLAPDGRIATLSDVAPADQAVVVVLGEASARDTPVSPQVALGALLLVALLRSRARARAR